MPTIPARPASVRVRIWRRLQAMGAVNLRGAVYVLPNREECVERFAWLTRELVELGGQAALCEGRFLGSTADDDLDRRFASARNAEYAEVAEAARAATAKLASRRGARARRDQAAEQHARLAQRLAAIIAIDFLAASGRARAEGQVAALGLALQRDGEPRRAQLARRSAPRGAVWVTRLGVRADRIASAWLIGRFIDPLARFKFVPAKGYVAAPGELRFDMFEGDFTHVGDRCTFEALVEQLAIEDPAIDAIGEIVHDLDLEDGKFGREETEGVRSTIEGVCGAIRDDAQRIAAVTPMLEGLYAHFAAHARRRARPRKPRT